MNEIIALHGFLGKATDWDGLGLDLEGFALEKIPLDSLWSWATHFNAYVKERYSQPILLGYSLGGRLALHALIQDPQLWQAGIIISAHPGLESDLDKEKRCKGDEEWAARFRTEEWGSLMASWNSQAVFVHGSFHFERKEKDYNRNELVNQLLNGSLSKQENLRPALKQLQIPLLWIVGERDATYCNLGRTLEFSHPDSRFHIVPAAGHRNPWEQPSRFKKAVQEFID